MFAAWLPALVLWMAFAMAGGQVSLTAAFPPAVLTIAVAAVLGLAVWQFCIRFPWPEKFRVPFYAMHIVAGLIYGIVWMVATSVIHQGAFGSVYTVGSPETPFTAVRNVWPTVW